MKCIFMTAMVAVFFISCGTTAKVESSWRDPEAVVDLSRLNKVLVMALLNNETNRRATEAQLVGLLQNKGVASYQYFSGPLGKANEALIKQRLKRDGFDGALVMRLADVEKDINYVQTSSAGATRFWPYFWNSWGSYSNGYYETTKTYTIETNVYSLKKDKLVWSSLTSSVDPQNTGKLMEAVNKEVYKKMQKEGFIVAN